MSLTLSLPGGYTLALTPPPPSDLAVAQAFVASCDGIGLNIERGHWRDLSYQNGPIAASPLYWRYLRSLGVSHVRFFLNYGFSGAGAVLTKADVQAFMVPIENAVLAGQRVPVDLIDVLQLSEAQQHEAQIEDYLAMACDVFAGMGFPVGSVAIGPVNEPADSTHAAWAPFLQRHHDILRSKLGAHVLKAPTADWDGSGDGTNRYDNGVGLANRPPLTDPRVVYSYHHYPQQVGLPVESPQTWATAATAVQAWSNTNGGLPVLCEEFGWGSPAGIVAAAQGAGAFRPMAWCVTSGTSGRINASSTDATIPPPIAAALAQAACIIRASS